jgi:hypothetical protein
LQNLEKHPAILSPDGEFRIVLEVKSEDDDYGSMHVYQRERLLRSFDLRDLSGGVFLKWSPDSRAFYLMWSDGGIIGRYSVRVFSVDGEKVIESPTTRVAERDFAKRYYCETRGNNVYAIRWVNAEQLLIAAEVYPTSDCGRDMGITAGYIVRVEDGHILRQYSGKQLQAMWPSDCPDGIWPSGLWGPAEMEKARKSQSRSQRSH